MCTHVLHTDCECTIVLWLPEQLPETGVLANHHLKKWRTVTHTAAVCKFWGGKIFGGIHKKIGLVGFNIEFNIGFNIGVQYRVQYQVQYLGSIFGPNIGFKIEFRIGCQY